MPAPEHGTGQAWSESTRSPRGTRAFARRLASILEPGMVLALVGEMGAGKTTFVQGLAAGLGVADLGQVLSPTYTLVNEYPGQLATLVHIDFYRLDVPEAALALGLEEQLGRSDAVVAVEWADRLPELLPADVIRVSLGWERTEEREHRKGRVVQVQGICRPPRRLRRAGEKSHLGHR